MVSPPPLKRRRLSASSTRPSKAPEANTVTIVSWNVNGIGPFIQPEQRPISSFFAPKSGAASPGRPPRASLRDFCKRNDFPDVLFLQEVQIRPDDTETIRAVEKAVAQDGQVPGHHAYVARFCLPSARHLQRKIYGCCSLIREDFYKEYVDTVRKPDWDTEGRVLVVETKNIGPAGPKLALINLYAVNGTDAPYRDPITGEYTGKNRHDYKLEVHRLLQVECAEYSRQGFGVVVAGDINVARASLDGHPNLRTFPRQHCVNRADFEARFFSQARIANDKEQTTDTENTEVQNQGHEQGLGLTDTFRYLHPTKKGYSYYPRTKIFGESCDRVDMVICSSSLTNALIEAGMHETSQARGPSDHVPIYARFKFELGHSTESVES